MLDEAPASPRPNVLYGAAAAVIVLAGMRAAGELLVPLLFSAFLAIVTAPAVAWMRARRVPQVLAVSLVVLGVLCLLLALVGVLGGSINQFIANVPRYQARLDYLLASASSTLQRAGVAVSYESLRKVIDPGAAIALAGSLLGEFAGVLSDALLVVLTMVLILLEGVGFPHKFRRAVGDQAADLSGFVEMTQEVKGYVLVKTYISTATGVLMGIYLAVVGVDFPILWALLTFLLDYIPNIGSIIAAVPPVLLAAIQLGPVPALVVAGGYLAVNLVVGNIVEPRLMGQRLGLSTLVVFLSLIFWGWLWGTLGMLLSVPLTMILKILAQHSPQLRWLAVLLDSSSAEPPPPVSRRPSIRPSIRPSPT